MGGQEAYHCAQLDRSCTMWLNALICCLVLGKSLGPMRRGSLPQGIPWDRWPLSSQVRSGGVIPGTGCPTPAVWLLVESDVSRVLGCNRWPWYPRYKTLTVGPEPSDKRVAGAGRLSDGKIGPHMVL
jgi:hypothetical protein